MNIDQKYMRRAIDLGKNALGMAAPNPMVGAVLVHNDKIIGEGYTNAYGGPHAEVNAITSVKNQLLLSEAILYVTLEPCSHFGKTPPCSDLIIKSGIKKVVIGLQDPNPKVAGKGIQKLKDSGCQVIVGFLEEECRRHHKRFLTVQEKKRPYIILKWAETADGFIAPLDVLRDKKPQPVWITNPYSRQLVHRWRSEEMAILAGTNTILKDDPNLTVRDWEGKNPTRIVLDRNLSLPQNQKVFDGTAQTIVLTEKNKAAVNKTTLFETVPFGSDLPQQICDILYRREVSSVLIEGGAQTLQSFMDAKLWDEARVFQGKASFGAGIAAPTFKGTLISTDHIVNDTLYIWEA